MHTQTYIMEERKDIWGMQERVTAVRGGVLTEYLDEGEFADAGTTLGVSDRDLSIVLDPPSTTQNVVHTCGHFIPLIMVTITINTKHAYYS